jgi:eukaryotic-like serine/threonine-protein kinase
MWDLFHQALDRPETERSAFLAAAGAEEELRREVEELLASHRRAEAGDGAELLATGWAAGAVDDPAAAPSPGGDGEAEIGTRLGAYRLVAELGSGGMGVVYLAERDDGELERRVAVKLLPPGLGTAAALARFREERQILARLDHPDIARLIDAGTSAGGRPYFVMEQVDGEPIDLSCRRRRLALADRVRLVARVCRAVHAAHQNLVVHRDIKPGNVLVTADGAPKLLDFGIAKRLDGDGAAPATVGPWRPMTPEYASPEQLRGEPVSTATDVYGLGVLLYELLTGVHPFRTPGTAPHEVARRICETRPVRPSAAVAAGAAGLDAPPERLARRLRGDLDAIVLAAMHPEPARRYASAERLAEDLERFLDGRPVVARADSLAYRAGKFVRRHRLAVAAAVLVVLLLAGFAAAMAVQSARVERQRVEAERERRRAERVSSFLVELFEVSYPTREQARSVTARELLDRGAERIAAGLEDEPEVEARLLATIANVYDQLGLYAEARPLLERRLELARALHGDEHPEVAEAHSQLAINAWRRGDYAVAESLHERVIALRRRLLGTDAPEVADSLNALAAMLHEAGEYARAETAHRAALAIRRARFGEESWQVSQSLGNLGWLLHDRGRFAEAEELYRRALALNRRLFGDEHRWVAQGWSNLALLHHDRGELDAAAEVYVRAWEMDRRLLGEEKHPDLAIHLHNQARLWHDRGDLERAERLYREALELRRAALPDDHSAIATSLAGLGRLLTDRGELAAAESLLRDALARRRAALAPGNWHIAEAESLLGACLFAAGRPAEAAPLLTAGLAAMESQRGDGDLRVRQARERVAALTAPRPARTAMAQAVLERAR